jgi:hypothetical protein
MTDSSASSTTEFVDVLAVLQPEGPLVPPHPNAVGVNAEAPRTSTQVRTHDERNRFMGVNSFSTGIGRTPQSEALRHALYRIVHAREHYERASGREMFTDEWNFQQNRAFLGNLGRLTGPKMGSKLRLLRNVKPSRNGVKKALDTLRYLEIS